MCLRTFSIIHPGRECESSELNVHITNPRPVPSQTFDAPDCPSFRAAPQNLRAPLAREPRARGGDRDERARRHVRERARLAERAREVAERERGEEVVESEVCKQTGDA